jgi:hypothetical protein
MTAPPTAAGKGEVFLFQKYACMRLICYQLFAGDREGRPYGYHP